MEEVQLGNNSNRAKRAVIFIQMLVLLNLFYILLCCWALFYNNYLIYRYPANGLDLFTRRSFLILEGIRNLTNLISAITFIAWSYRANKNLWRIQPEMKLQSFWILFAWFIPVISWFMPYRIMRRLVERTLSELETEDRKSSVYTVNNWWIWWLLFAAASYGMTLVQYNYNGTPNRNLDCCMLIAVMIIALILCRCTIRMIRSYAALEADLYHKYTAGYASEKRDDLIDQL